MFVTIKYFEKKKKIPMRYSLVDLLNKNLLHNYVLCFSKPGFFCSLKSIFEKKNEIYYFCRQLLLL